MTPAEAFGAARSAERRRGPATELERFVDFAIAAADEADAMALASFRREITIDRKPDDSPVTAIDRGIEERVRTRIRERWPDHGVIGEEYGIDRGEAATRWFIDPIDGTANFIRGVPLFGTLLALERDGEMQLGVMTAPALRERWIAWRGGGAWVTGSAGLAAGEWRRIEVSAVATIDEAQILYSSPADLEASGRVPGLWSLLRRAWRDRGFGDFWGYALVAEGAAEAMIEVGVSTWDLAAPLVVVEEAGGRLTDLAGHRDITGRSVLASNGRLHDELIAALRG